MPVRSAVLLAAASIDPDALDLEVYKDGLLYGEGEYRWVGRWRFRDPALAEAFKASRPGTRATFSSLEDYYRLNKLLPPIDPKERDEHYAERVFVEEAFLPVFGLEGLSYLRPQVDFLDSSKRRRYVDFVLEGSKKYAIEIEGKTYHAREHIGEAKFDDEKQRQRDLGQAGYLYFPFSFSDIRQKRAQEVLTRLASEDRILHYLFLANQRSEHSPKPSTLVRLEQLLRFLPKRFPLYQKAILAMLESANREGKNELTLVDYEPVTSGVALALLDTFALVERVAELYGYPVVLPRVRLYVLRPADPDLFMQVMELYRCHGESSFVDLPRTSIEYELVDRVPNADLVDYIFAAEAVSSPPSGALDEPRLERFAAPFVGEVNSEPPLKTNPASVERTLLDFFARRYFAVRDLKPEQARLLQRALLGQSGLGILPTGFGKSLVFQLYSLLIPRTTLVISPLKALIRDQVHSMHRLGLVCVDSISSFDSSAVKEHKLAEFRRHRYRLLYISPERLQIKGFYEELRASMQDTPVGALAIDEAHCVSEWGHDFRPAYLQIGRLRHLLEEASGRTIPIIALTATASEAVRKDVCDVLGLELESVVQLASSDRPNLSLSVHTSGAYGLETKEEVLEHLLTRVVPTALRIEKEDLIPLGKEPPYKHAGVVFGIYANPHGKTTLAEGVHHIAKVIRERVSPDPEFVQVHASTPPTVCPNCRSQLYLRLTRKELKLYGMTRGYRCLECKEVFPRYSYVSNWENTILERQDAFQNNQFPILVATKGYGMGIDKRNIRFIIHYALSSGLEGYYQEAGRAGRDGKQSHVALIYSPPTQECYEKHLRHHEEPPCVSVPHNFNFHKCPYKLPGLCDYGKQAYFVKASYPGLETDLERALSVYDRLLAGEVLTRDDPDDDEEENKGIQMALYRLQQLGIVKGYSLTYKSLREVVFEAEFDPNWQPETMLHHLRQYLLRTEGEAYVEQRLAELGQRVNGNRRRVSEVPGGEKRRQVEMALKVLLERVYTTIRKTRYYMLERELDYAQSHEEGVCRRVKIRSYFDDIGFSDDYRCGFCDVCVPDLKFTRDQAEIPVRDAQVDDLARILPELVASFQPDKLTEAVRVTVDRGAVVGMTSRIANRLEKDITNVSSLYLAGALSRRRKGREEEAISYLKSAFEEGVRQDFTPENLVFIAKEAAQLNVEEAFSWLTPVDGPFNTDHGLKLLEEQAKQLYGAEAPATRVVRALRHTRRVARTADSIQRLKQPVAELLAGFDSLQTMMGGSNVQG